MRIIPTPALDLWWHDLAEGKRTATEFDALRRAACEEMNAQEAYHVDHELAQSYLDRADRILRDATRIQEPS